VIVVSDMQTMNHIVDTFPLTQFEGGLNLLHEADDDDDAVIWLESSATAALVKYYRFTLLFVVGYYISVCLAAVLAAPSRPEVSSVSETSVLVQWTMSSSSVAHVTSFRLQYKRLADDRSAAVWKTVDEDIPAGWRSYEVVKLRPGTPVGRRSLQSKTSCRPAGGETICPPPMAVRLAADLRPSADGSAVRTWLSCRQPAYL